MSGVATAWHNGSVPVPNPDRTFEQHDELTLLAMLVAGEARGESIAGRIAVAWVARNRVAADLRGDRKPDWWGEGWRGVILKPYQFSCFLPNDPNVRKLRKPLEWMAAVTWGQCYEAAALVYFGAAKDPTGGADHYHVSQMKSPPAWRDPMKITAVIDSHTFYRLER